MTPLLASNPRGTADAGLTVSLHLERHWPRAADPVRWTSVWC
jgi:hypothetical protein